MRDETKKRQSVWTHNVGWLRCEARSQPPVHCRRLVHGSERVSAGARTLSTALGGCHQWTPSRPKAAVCRPRTSFIPVHSHVVHVEVLQPHGIADVLGQIFGTKEEKGPAQIGNLLDHPVQARPTVGRL
jgi:hypothetical protein